MVTSGDGVRHRIPGSKAYRIERGTGLGGEIRRIASGQVDDAIFQLSRQPDELGTGIHEARRRFKEMRALLRLVRDDLGPLYRPENARYRDYGERLSGARDAEAMVECFDKVIAVLPNGPAESLMASWHEVLRRHADQLSSEGRDAHQAAALQVREKLVGCKDAISAWPLRQLSRRGLNQGFEHTYRRCRNAYRRAKADPTSPHFHEWRKQAKYHWYQCRLLRDVSSSGLKSRRKALKRLSDQLGDHQDLVVLRQALIGTPGDVLDETDMRQILGLVDGCQARLRRAALESGKVAFAPKPPALSGQVLRHSR